MPIKYGELTIIHKEPLSSLWKWLHYEVSPSTNSKYAFLFDDGEICDINKAINISFNFMNSSFTDLPIWIEKKIETRDSNNRLYFYKNKIEKEKNAFDPLFSSYSNYNRSTVTPSCYNSIYYCYKGTGEPEILGIIRIQSNEYMPRFQFAYESDEFTKEEIIYIIHRIFNPLHYKNT